MSGKYAQIIELLESGEGLTYRQIADKVGTTEGYVRTSIYRYRHKGVSKLADDKVFDFENAKAFWYKSDEYSVYVRMPENGISYEQMRDDIISEMQKHAPQYPSIIRTASKESHCLVVDPADIHIGKIADSFETGEDYNVQLAVQRVREGIIGLIEKTAGYDFEKVVLIGGNDILHIDTPRRTTTSGTPQDTDGMWYQNFTMGRKLMVDVIEHLAAVADVHFVYCPSNHDYMAGFFLADSIRSWFSQSTNVTFDTSIAHRKYFLYGVNLIGATHGDGAKHHDLPDLMKTEARAAWAQAKYGYWYTHHVHHKDRSQNRGKKKDMIEKDYMDVTVIKSNPHQNPQDKVYVEYVRSCSGTDSWAHRNGYQHAPKAIEAFIHHPYQGQVARITHHF